MQWSHLLWVWDCWTGLYEKVTRRWTNISKCCCTDVNKLAEVQGAPDEIHGRLARWIKWRACNVGEAKGCSFSNLSVTSPTSQLILQPFRRFNYVTAHSPTLPLLHLRHSSFSNRSFDSSTSQALHVTHLASRPWRNQKARLIILSLGDQPFSILSALDDVR